MTEDGNETMFQVSVTKRYISYKAHAFRTSFWIHVTDLPLLISMAKPKLSHKILIQNLAVNQYIRQLPVQLSTPHYEKNLKLHSLCLLCTDNYYY